MSEQILSRLARLDHQALASVHDEYYPVVYRYVRYRVGDDQTGEDITAEVFLRLLEALKVGRGPNQNLKAWLLGTASHLAIDHLRRKYTRQEDGLDDHDLTAAEDTEKSFDQNWENQQIRLAMQALTPEQQHVLALRFSQGYSVEETAHLMQKNIGAVKTLQFRALSTLRRKMDERVTQ